MINSSLNRIEIWGRGLAQVWLTRQAVTTCTAPKEMALSAAMAKATGKPETYVMVTLHETSVMMGGAAGPAAFCDVRGIGGMKGPSNGKIAEAVCALLKAHLSIAGDRVYLNFTDVPGTQWGWNGATFS